LSTRRIDTVRDGQEHAALSRAATTRFRYGSDTCPRRTAALGQQPPSANVSFLAEC